MMNLLRIGVMVAFSLAGTALAEEMIPSAKPIIVAAKPIASDVEYFNFRKAMRAAREKNWDEVRSYRAGITSPAAKDLLLWRLAINDPKADFFELKEAVETLKDWPRHIKIRREAESKISTSGLLDEYIIKYFDQWPAISGKGKLAFARALSAKDFTVEAQAQIRSAWRNNTLTRDEERTILAAYGKTLDQSDHLARADAMLWARQRSATARMLPRLRGKNKNLILARYKLMRNANGIDSAVRHVASADQNDGGLLYERAYWRRRHGLADEAVELVLKFPEGSQNKTAARRMWTERHLLARRAIKDGDYSTSYSLVARHGMSKGAKFAEAEWLAGWLALQKLNDPILALSHFTRLKDGVTTPVSLARAYYWIGRAQQAMGMSEAAKTAWQKASTHDFTYYGQLAAQELGAKTLDLGHDPVPTVEQRKTFQDNLQIQALTLIGLTGNTSLFRTFSYHLDDLLPNAVDHVMLATLANEMGNKRAALRAAKAALRRGEVLPDSAWPVIALPDSLSVDKAFLLALMRQETELDPKAVSRVGAQGLMQLMPTTARHTARILGKRYRKSWLTSDPQYNTRLGTAHLAALLDEFDGSYILAAVSYNAGKTRAYRWIKEYGDPRAEANPIDWVETIPFSETRNYVQRILENVQVYRHRLAQAPTAINLWADLNRGARKAEEQPPAPIANCVIVTLPDPKGTSAFCPRLIKVAEG
jgi:peptidoglycan lytic transglycosylase